MPGSCCMLSGTAGIGASEPGANRSRNSGATSPYRIAIPVRTRPRDPELAACAPLGLHRPASSRDVERVPLVGVRAEGGFAHPTA